ncbi:MAG TPA: hypothetical protein VK588_05110 [Chitinophagaceae bacterium]|nr:hypothetical protein [Chitinophagaceae bacterium]
MADKNGWLIQVNTGKTESSQISFYIGTDSNNRNFWVNWQSGNPTNLMFQLDSEMFPIYKSTLSQVQTGKILGFV